jgi:hypothetical protein
MDLVLDEAHINVVISVLFALELSSAEVLDFSVSDLRFKLFAVAITHLLHILLSLLFSHLLFLFAVMLGHSLVGLLVLDHFLVGFFSSFLPVVLVLIHLGSSSWLFLLHLELLLLLQPELQLHLLDFQVKVILIEIIVLVARVLSCSGSSLLLHE